MPSSTANKSLRQIGAGELLRDLGAVALGDAGDHRFLGAEIAIEIARAHAGLGADLLHRGLVEARAHETALAPRSRISAAAVGWSWTLAPRMELCPAIIKRERSFAHRFGAAAKLNCRRTLDNGRPFMTLILLLLSRLMEVVIKQLRAAAALPAGRTAPGIARAEAAR